ncbi:hypothetical protein [Caudoviricetes sp.]|jgi:ribosomal protein S3AE|nr:hypothetical protein [Caudoviricetes sp.]
MRSLETLINQLQADNHRIEERATHEIERIRQHCLTFFNHQQQQTDSFVAAMSVTLDRLMVNMRDGFPDPHDQMSDEVFPAVVTGRQLTDEDRANIMAKLAATVDQNHQ